MKETLMKAFKNRLNYFYISGFAPTYFIRIMQILTTTDLYQSFKQSNTFEIEKFYAIATKSSKEYFIYLDKRIIPNNPNHYRYIE